MNYNDYVNRGGEHVRAKEYDLAISDYTEAIKLDPKNAKAHNRRGLAYMAKGEQELANADIAEALRLTKMKQ